MALDASGAVIEGVSGRLGRRGAADARRAGQLRIAFVQITTAAKEWALSPYPTGGPRGCDASDCSEVRVCNEGHAFTTVVAHAPEGIRPYDRQLPLSNTAALPARVVVYIAVEGNAGSGKTTIADFLATALNFKRVLEPGAETLADLYVDIDLRPLAVQMHCLAARLRAQQEIADARVLGVVTDFHLVKDDVYARVWLDAPDYRAYEALFRQVEWLAQTPDLLVVLTAPVEVLLDRVCARNRQFEAFVDTAFLERLEVILVDRLADLACPRVDVDSTSLTWPLDKEELFDALEWPR